MTCGDKFNKNCPTGGTRVEPAEADGRPVCDHPGCGKKLRGDGTCVDGHVQGAGATPGRRDLETVARRAYVELERIMPEFEPSGDRTHPAWETLADLRAALDGVDAAATPSGKGAAQAQTKAKAALRAAARCAVADLEGIMPEFEPSGDRTDSAWQTLGELKAALEEPPQTGTRKRQRLAAPQVRSKKALRDLVATLDGAGLILTDEDELARELRQWQKPQVATVQEIMELLPDLDGAGVILTDDSLLRRELRAQGYRDTSVEAAQEMATTFVAEIAQADHALLWTDPHSGATHLSLQQGCEIWGYTRHPNPEEGGFGRHLEDSPDAALAEMVETARHPDVEGNRHCLVCGQFLPAEGGHACPGQPLAAGKQVGGATAVGQAEATAPAAASPSLRDLIATLQREFGPSIEAAERVVVLSQGDTRAEVVAQFGPRFDNKVIVYHTARGEATTGAFILAAGETVDSYVAAAKEEDGKLEHCPRCGEAMAADGSHVCPGTAAPPAVVDKAAARESPSAARVPSYWDNMRELRERHLAQARASYPGTPDTAAEAAAKVQELLRAVTGRDDFVVLSGGEQFVVEPKGREPGGPWQDLPRRDKNLLQAVTGVGASWFGRAAFDECSWRGMVRHLETVRTAQEMLRDPRHEQDMEGWRVLAYYTPAGKRRPADEPPRPVELAAIGPTVLRTLPPATVGAAPTVELTVMEDLPGFVLGEDGQRKKISGEGMIVSGQPLWAVHTIRRVVGGQTTWETSWHPHAEAQAIVEAKRQEAVEEQTLNCFSCGCPYGKRETCPNCGQQKKRTRLWAPGWRRA